MTKLLDRKIPNWVYMLIVLGIIAAVVLTCSCSTPQANQELSQERVELLMREQAELADTVRIKKCIGFFVLTPWSKYSTIEDSVLSNPTVTGLAYRAYWRELNPAPDVYDWARLDTLFFKALRLNKKITIQVAAGCKAPDWVPCRRIVFNEYHNSGGGGGFELIQYIQPVIWDSGYVNAYTKFIAALGTHIKTKGDSAQPWWSRVVLVHVTGVNRTTSEFRLPCLDTVTGSGGTSTHASELWREAGYSTDKVIMAHEQFTDAYALAFNRRLLCLSFLTGNDFPTIDREPCDTAIQILYSTYGERASYKYTSLSSDFKTDRWNPANRHSAIKALTPNFGYQLSESLYGNGDNPTLDSAIYRGISFGGKFFEVSIPVVVNQSQVLSKYKALLNQK